MHGIARLFVMIAMTALAATPAYAQDDLDEAFLPLTAVLEHRAIIGDGAPFSLCALYDAVGRPEALIAQLGSLVRYLDHQDLQRCEALRDPGTVEPTRCVSRLIDVREYLVGVSTSFITLRVSAGASELSYSEEYRLRRIGTSGRWRVEEVRLHSWANELRRDLCEPS